MLLFNLYGIRLHYVLQKKKKMAMERDYTSLSFFREFTLLAQHRRHSSLLEP